MFNIKSRYLGLLVVLLIVAMSCSVLAENGYPTKQVEIIVAYDAGGTLLNPNKKVEERQVNFANAFENKEFNKNSNRRVK